MGYGTQPGDRMLTWAGKSDPGPVPVTFVPHVMAPIPAPMLAPPVVQPSYPVPSPPANVYPMSRLSSPVPGPSDMSGRLPPPVSMTAAGSMAPPRVAVATPPGSDAQARLYSLHRDYGLEPDAAPQAPAVFTTSADLAGQDLNQASPQPSPKTPAGRKAIAATRMADTTEGQP